jgi:outer membrane protein assembly factor BamB
MRFLAGWIFLALGGLVSMVAADDWPQWRGPRLDGNGTAEPTPVRWSKTENVVWRFALPGPAGSSPVIAGDNVFVVSPDGDDIFLICLSTDGQERWRQKFGSGVETFREDEGNTASPSPCTDGQRVWALDGNGNFACVTVGGELVWSKNLQEAYGNYKIQFGMASTPVLYEGNLYLQLIHGAMRDPESSSAWVVALNGQTGEEVWKHLRETPATAENKHSYASPTVYFDGPNSFLIVHGADYVTAHSFADGSELWRCGNLNPKDSYNPFLRFVASPACGPNLIVVPSAKNGPVLGLKPGFRGDITDQSDAYHWRMETQTPDVPTPVVHDGLVYLCRENGVLICVDAATGEQIYEERVESDRHRGSPIVAGGHIYLTSRRGNVAVVKTGREYELVAKNSMGEPMSASPAVSGGRLYLRTFDALYCVGEAATGSSGGR